jgi:hypothetical protein
MLLVLGYIGVGLFVGRIAFRRILDWMVAEFPYAGLDGSDYFMATLLSMMTVAMWPLMLVGAGLFHFFKKDYDKRKFHDAS